MTWLLLGVRVAGILAGDEAHDACPLASVVS
jgi:hypothetical protein